MGPTPLSWFLLHHGGGGLETWGHPGIKDTSHPPCSDSGGGWVGGRVAGPVTPVTLES